MAGTTHWMLKPFWPRCPTLFAPRNPRVACSKQAFATGGSTRRPTRRKTGPSRAAFKPPPFPSGAPKPTYRNKTNIEPKIKILRSDREVRPLRASIAAHHRSVGLVPTMGALHEGHLKLMRRAAEENQDVVVSIYVNPTQFGVTEDLASYPRTLPADLEKLRLLNEELRAGNYRGRVSIVFAPTTKAMYPTLPPTSEIGGKGSYITITPLGELLEGASRPVFFRGVATICMKLFNIVSPTRVYFGQKDVQQTAVIRRMVRDFHVNTKVVVVATEREADGLAMSSRNVFLGERRRRVAAVLSRALRLAEECYKKGGRKRDLLLLLSRNCLDAEVERQRKLLPAERAQMELVYLSLADPDTMEEVDEVDEARGAVVSAALKMLPVEEAAEGEDTGEGDGGARVVRLIDNIILEPIGASRQRKSAP